MPELTVTSEIYAEFDYRTKQKPALEGNVISEFPFILPKQLPNIEYDEDNDLDVERPLKELIKIEHSPKTKLQLVGLQVWRGAFLLADLLINIGLKGELMDKVVLELGAGTGITSLIAAMYCRKVICTDIDIGGILSLIKLNAKYNAKIINAQFKVMELDFAETNWNQKLADEVSEADIVVAADVVYDDDVTAALIATIQKLLNSVKPKTLYVTLEKRYVFTIENLDSVAPCYETFLNLLDKVKCENVHSEWKVEQMPINFPQYFKYDRVKELVLWKISSKPIN